MSHHARTVSVDTAAVRPAFAASMRSCDSGSGGPASGGMGSGGTGVPPVRGVPSTTAPQHPIPQAPPLVGAIVQSTTFIQPHVGAQGTHAYSRVSNPTVSELEQALGALEGAPPAVAFSSGLSAETTLFLTLLRAGDHAVLGDAIYGGTSRLFQRILSELGIAATFVDTSDPANIAGAVTARTRLVFIETPANPTLKLTDIRACARAAHDAGALLVVDNTFLTPVLQRPLDLGADIAVYATTKHIEGHSLAVGGAITSRDEALLDRLRFTRKCLGTIQSPHNAWLTTRGIRTLPLRLRAQSANALTVARFLNQHPLVAKVNYPGLPDFPQRALAAAQHLGAPDTAHGGVVSFEVVGGTNAAVGMLNSARLCALVEHIGSVETLITHPATMTHADVPPDQRRAAGIADGLIRLSVGLEDPGDVIADLDRALRLAHHGADVEPKAGVVEPVLNGSALAVEGGGACLSTR